MRRAAAAYVVIAAAMEVSGGDGTQARPGGPSRAVLMRRRLVALAVVAALAGGLWLVLFGGDDDSPAPEEPAAQAGAGGKTGVLVAELSVEERADQVLMLGFDGTTASGDVLAEVRSRQLGALVIDTDNWAGAEAGTQLARELVAAGRAGDRIPPVLATTQEGGQYRSLPDLPPEQTELQVGDAGSLPGAEEWARAGGIALHDAGILLNLAPVADVATLDSPVADRAFSDDPALAADMTAAAIRGCNAAAIACAPLHFPGLGAASQDTARGPATVGLDAGGLAARDLAPFDAAFTAGAPAVVLSLASYTAYDAVTPGALAEPVATGLLRDELGFDGVAISDDLASGAVRAGYSPRDAAVAALAAGTDLVQISSPEQQNGVAEEIVAAVEDGRLSEERLAQAAGRVLELKRELGLLDSG